MTAMVMKSQTVNPDLDKKVKARRISPAGFCFLNLVDELFVLKRHQVNDYLQKKSYAGDCYFGYTNLKYGCESCQMSKRFEYYYEKAWKDDFEGVLKTVMYLANTCYLNTNEHDRVSAAIPDFDLLFAKELKRKYPLHHFD